MGYSSMQLSHCHVHCLQSQLQCCSMQCNIMIMYHCTTNINGKVPANCHCHEAADQANMKRGQKVVMYSNGQSDPTACTFDCLTYHLVLS